MLADQLDYVIGVDPHRADALAVIAVVTGAIVFEANVAARSDGYAHALTLVEQHAAGRRAFAIEVSRLRRERRTGGKTDALDAIRPPAASLRAGGRQHHARR